MPFDDPFDDEWSGPDRLLPPEDRLWRHPSEVHEQGRAADTPPAPTPGRGRTNLLVLGAALAGAAMALGFLWATRPTDSIDEEQATITTVSPTTPQATPVGVFSNGRIAREAASLVGSSVARLEVRRGDDWTTVTALWMDDRGTLLTAASAVTGADELAVIGAKSTRQTASLLGVDDATTLAALAVERTDGTPFDLAAERPRPGAPAAVVGAGMGGGRVVVTEAEVTAVGERVTIDDAVLHDTVHLAGRLPADLSGGALVNAAGELVAVIVGNADDPAGAAAVPGATAIDTATQLRVTGEVKRPWLGIRAVDLDTDRSTILGVTGGARLTEVTADSPADEAGLEPGDVVVSIGGREVSDSSDLVVALRSHEPGARLTVTVRRGAEEKVFTATLGG